MTTKLNAMNSINQINIQNNTKVMQWRNGEMQSKNWREIEMTYIVME